MPLALSMFGTVVYFLDDLKEGDAMAYKDIIRDAVRIGEDMHKQRVEGFDGHQDRAGQRYPSGQVAV